MYAHNIRAKKSIHQSVDWLRRSDGDRIIFNLASWLSPLSLLWAELLTLELSTPDSLLETLFLQEKLLIDIENINLSTLTFEFKDESFNPVF